MPINAGLFTSTTDLWATPQDFFDKLDAEFHFTLDVCALPENAKCPRYYTPEDDGLSQPWSGVCWCNPPYGREIGKWVAKAAESAESGATVVMLLPARTDTRWFHEYIYGKAEIRFVPGRLKFGGSKNSAPFPSMVAVFGSSNKRPAMPGGGNAMNDQNDLKPCPFCGGEAIFLKKCSVERGVMRGWEFGISCAKCGVTTPKVSYKLEIAMETNGEIEANVDERPLAIEAWNRRAT